MEKTVNEKINIDELCEMLIAGKRYRDIAKHFGTSLTSLTNYIANSEHSARARAALEASADLIADEAENCLKKAPSSMPEIQRAKELSQYYKWRAATRNRAKYNDKVDITQKVFVEQPIFPDVYKDDSSQEDNKPS